MHGLVATPTVFSMADLLALPSVDVTATLVCAGNRRKEENMVRQTIGFNWGPSGTGCSTWTGVRLADVLAACGVKSPAEGAGHVCFRGPKGEAAAPAGRPAGVATSSQPACLVLVPNTDIVLGRVEPKLTCPSRLPACLPCLPSPPLDDRRAAQGRRRQLRHQHHPDQGAGPRLGRHPRLQAERPPPHARPRVPPAVSRVTAGRSPLEE